MRRILKRLTLPAMALAIGLGIFFGMAHMADANPSVSPPTVAPPTDPHALMPVSDQNGNLVLGPDGKPGHDARRQRHRPSRSDDSGAMGDATRCRPFGPGDH